MAASPRVATLEDLLLLNDAPSVEIGTKCHPRAGLRVTIHRDERTLHVLCLQCAGTVVIIKPGVVS